MWLKVCIPDHQDNIVNMEKVHRVELDDYGQGDAVVRAFLDNGGCPVDNQFILFSGPLLECEVYLEWLERQLDISGSLLRYFCNNE